MYLFVWLDITVGNRTARRMALVFNFIELLSFWADKCNGYKNCLDATDELNCSCAASYKKCKCKLFQNSSVCVGPKSCYTDTGKFD